MVNTSNKPSNWLLVTFDQWRGDWLHQSWLHLPNLKHLSRTGWDVRRCYTSSPQCIPARASWLTGLTPGQLGVTKNMHYTVPSNSPSLREICETNTVFIMFWWENSLTPHVKGADLRDNMSLMRDLGFDHNEKSGTSCTSSFMRVDRSLARQWSSRKISI